MHNSQATASTQSVSTYMLLMSFPSVSTKGHLSNVLLVGTWHSTTSSHRALTSEEEDDAAPRLLPRRVEGTPDCSIQGACGRLTLHLEVAACPRRFSTLAVFCMKGLSGVADCLLHAVPGTFQTSNFTSIEKLQGSGGRESKGQGRQAALGFTAIKTHF